MYIAHSCMSEIVCTRHGNQLDTVNGSSACWTWFCHSYSGGGSSPRHGNQLDTVNGSSACWTWFCHSYSGGGSSLSSRCDSCTKVIQMYIQLLFAVRTILSTVCMHT